MGVSVPRLTFAAPSTTTSRLKEFVSDDSRFTFMYPEAWAVAIVRLPLASASISMQSLVHLQISSVEHSLNRCTVSREKRDDVHKREVDWYLKGR
jgi:hypothetical protein